MLLFHKVKCQKLQIFSVKMGENAHQLPLLHDHDTEDAQIEAYTGDGFLDRHGNPALKSKTGNWRACFFILGTQCCEGLAYYGIIMNLVTYLITKLHIDNATAARMVNTWFGTCYLAPIVGALLADTFLGRYQTIAVFFTLYFIGLVSLTLSAFSLHLPACVNDVCPKASTLQYGVFLTALYLVALGTGSIKPCISSFGADQFDDSDAQERKKKGSFFNWYYFTFIIGAVFAGSIVVWVQDNVGWGWGFGILTVSLAMAIINFFSGTPLYRFQKPGGSPLNRIFQVIIVSLRNFRKEIPQDTSLLYEVGGEHSAIKGSRKIKRTNSFKCLDKAAIITDDSVYSGKCSPWKLCTVTQVEEVKMLLRLFPIWAVGIAFAAVYAQLPMTFLEQGIFMDTSLGSFSIPPASLSLFDTVTVIVSIPIYDHLVVKIVHRYTGEVRGFTQLQRMGSGLVLPILAMAAAATVEIVRLNTVREHGLVHNTTATVPMSILWQIPQYCLYGVSEVFFVIGQMEFFYEESPDAMRSLCAAFCLLTQAFGSYLSSLILTIVTSISTRGGKPGWIPNNLNEGHLDYYFWLLAGLSLLNLFVYIACACKYEYKKSS